MKPRDIDNLEECQKAVEKLEEQKEYLEEENRHLRQAAGAFGQLAERLNITLREERRRHGGDRRRVVREAPERRSPDLARAVDDDR